MDSIYIPVYTGADTISNLYLQEEIETTASKRDAEAYTAGITASAAAERESEPVAAASPAAAETGEPKPPAAAESGETASSAPTEAGKTAASVPEAVIPSARPVAVPAYAVVTAVAASVKSEAH